MIALIMILIHMIHCSSTVSGIPVLILAFSGRPEFLRGFSVFRRAFSVGLSAVGGLSAVSLYDV